MMCLSVSGGVRRRNVVQLLTGPLARWSPLRERRRSQSSQARSLQCRIRQSRGCFFAPQDHEPALWKFGAEPVPLGLGRFKGRVRRVPVGCYDPEIARHAVISPYWMTANLEHHVLICQEQNVLMGELFFAALGVFQLVKLGKGLVTLHLGHA